MEFSVNHPILFMLVGGIILVVLAQSFYFLLKAMRQAKKIGMSNKIVRKTIITSAVFTIAPAVSIVIAILSLSQSLGLALPWLRLSVIGSLSYEAIAAQNAASGMGYNLSELAGDMGGYDHIVRKLYLEGCVGKSLNDRTFKFDYIIFSQDPFPPEIFAFV